MSGRDSNRASMPKVAAFVDTIRAEFGEGVKVLYASENGIERGKRDEERGTDIPTDSYALRLA